MSTATPEIPGYVNGTWVVDAAHSHVGFVVRHLMVSKVRGAFTDFEASIVTAEELCDSKVTAVIRTDSIDTKNEGRDSHVRTGDFFDVDNHPTMTFESTSVRTEGGEWKIDGLLTIRGITKETTLAVESLVFGQGFDETPKLGVSASTEINRLDFGVSFNGPVPGGGVVLADNVTIVLDIEADLIS